MSYAELLGRVCKTLQWPIDEIRLWDQSQFEDFVSETYDPFNTSAYRDLVPRFVSLDEFEVVFPMFLSDMYVVAERFAGREPEFPPNARPEVLTRNEWWLSVLEQWEGRQPEIDRTAYGVVEVVRMERNARNNTLFSSLGYLFHVIAKVKGEEVFFRLTFSIFNVFFLFFSF